MKHCLRHVRLALACRGIGKNGAGSESEPLGGASPVVGASSGIETCFRSF